MADIDPSSALGPWQNFKPLTPLNYLDQALKMQQMQKYSLENAQALAQQRAFSEFGADATQGSPEAIRRLGSVGAFQQGLTAAHIPSALTQGNQLQANLESQSGSQIAQLLSQVPEESRSTYAQALISEAIQKGRLPAQQGLMLYDAAKNPALLNSWIYRNLTSQQKLQATGEAAYSQSQAELPAAATREGWQPPVEHKFQGPGQEIYTVPYPRTMQPGVPRTPMQPPGPGGYLGPRSGPPMPGGIPGVAPRIGPQSSVQPGELAPITAPPQYASLIQKAAAENNVPPELLTRLLSAESEFNPNAQGRPIVKLGGARAQGIAQFIPTTAKEQGITNPFDPEQAIPGAAKYLRQLYEEKGSWHDALTGYLGGDPSRDAQYLRKGVPQLALQLDRTGTAGIAPTTPVSREQQAFPAPATASPETPSPGATAQRALLPSTPGATAQPPSAATPAAQPANFDVAIGDSIAVQQVRHGVGGTEAPFRSAGLGPTGTTARIGDTPQQVLARINSQETAPETVFLSSGTSNNPDQAGYVGDQIKALREKGAKNIVVPGVGPGVKNADAVNASLKSVVEENGGTFFIPDVKWQKDGIHPAEVDKVKQQGLQALASREPSAAELARAEPELPSQTNVQLAAQVTPAQAAGAPSVQPIPTTQEAPTGQPKLILEAGAVPGEAPTPPPPPNAGMPGRLNLPYGTLPPGVPPSPIPGAGIVQPSPTVQKGFDLELGKASERAGKIQEESEASQKAMQNVINFESALRGYETGKTAEIRQGMTNWATDIGKYFGIQGKEREIEAANAKLMQTAGSLLGFDLVKALGSREAMQVVAQVMSIKPNLKATPEDNKLILEAIKQGLNYSIAKNHYLRDNFQQNGSNFIGLPERFEQFNPPEKYASRVLPLALPDDPKDRIDQVYYEGDYKGKRRVFMWDASKNQFVTTGRKFSVEQLP